MTRSILQYKIYCNCVYTLVILLSERLADSLRLPQVIPSIQAQVFLCFRVLLLRMSPQHATSLWPVIVSELVQVFLYIEQELNTDSEEFRYANFSDPCAFEHWANSLMGRCCFICAWYMFLHDMRLVIFFFLDNKYQDYFIFFTFFQTMLYFEFQRFVVKRIQQWNSRRYMLAWVMHFEIGLIIRSLRFTKCSKLENNRYT